MLAREREDCCHAVTSSTLLMTSLEKQTGTSSYQTIECGLQGAALVIDLVATFIPRNSCLYWEELVLLDNAGNQDSDHLHF